MKNKLIAGCALAAIILSGCNPVNSVKKKVYRLAKAQYTAMDERLKDKTTPRYFDDEGVHDAGLTWWCSGFLPGSMWYVYEATQDPQMKALAEKHTLKLSDLCKRKTDHDIGFQINCSYGNAYRITGDTTCLPVIEAAAAKLAKRYNPVTGCIKSWDNPKYEYPVIIDNMMNLELLMNAAELFNCDSLRKIAISHAGKTMLYHYRRDFSSFHLVDYDTENGGFNKRMTVQGFSDNSAWSRGQAWGLYGFTMMYDKTGDGQYLSFAEGIADYIISHLPEDGIPYWDFNAPGTPDEVDRFAPGHPLFYNWKKGEPVLRDASAAAIMASAFLKLSTLTEDKDLAKLYRKTAKTQILTLGSKEYLAKAGENGNFLLKHSVGNMHGDSEVDVPLTYADYYFLEALSRY